jgi:hypothetical protein
MDYTVIVPKNLFTLDISMAVKQTRLPTISRSLNIPSSLVLPWILQAFLPVFKRSFDLYGNN